MRPILFVIAVCLLAAWVPQARAQTPTASDVALLEPPGPMQGYYYSAGVHGGMLRVRDDGKPLSLLSGLSLSLHLGQSVTTWMDLGVALEVGFVIDSERSGSLFSFGFDWTLRPVDTLFLRLSSSLGVSQLSAAKNSDNTANTFGAVAGMTVGYAFFPFYEPKESGGFALSPVMRVSAVQPFTDSAAYWVMGGFEITWWSGLAKRQLEVPLKDAFPQKRAP